LVTLGAVDPQGRWVFFCEADAKAGGASLASSQTGAKSSFVGKAFKPYLSRANSQPLSVEVLLAKSPNGRYLVLYSESNGPELLDVETNRLESLASLDMDIQADAIPGDLRSIAFSPNSNLLAFLVHKKQPRVIVRDLQNGSESEVVPVGDTVWRIAFDASSQYLVSTEVLEDTNHNGRPSWPLPPRRLAETRCKTPISALAAYLPSGDATRISIAPVHGGKSRIVPGFIAGLGQSLILRQPSGALSAIEGSKVRAFSSPDCDAHIIAIAPEFRSIVTGCRDGKGRSNVELDGGPVHRKLDFDMPSSSVDWVVPDFTPYVVIYSGAHSYLVDVAAGRAILLEDRDQVLAQGQSGILVRRGTVIVLLKPTSLTSVTLLNGVQAGTRIVMGDTVALVGQSVVSAAEGRVLGSLAKPALAMASNGCGVVSMGKASDGDLFARGPLSWSCPVP